MPAILGTNQILKGNGLEGAKEKISTNGLKAWQMSACFYPPILTLINRIHVDNRMLVLGPAGLIFNSFV